MIVISLLLTIIILSSNYFHQPDKLYLTCNYQSNLSMSLLSANQKLLSALGEKKKKIAIIDIGDRAHLSVKHTIKTKYLVFVLTAPKKENLIIAVA